MSKDNFVLQIKASYNQFTRAEKKVADYVLDNQEKVLYMSITDLADACEVGDASVYRFCRTMKLQGYQEFKMKLSLSQAASEGFGTEAGRGREDSFGATGAENHGTAYKRHQGNLYAAGERNLQQGDFHV